MNLKTRQSITLIVVIALALTALGISGSAFAASNIYVNDSNNTLGVDLGSAYAVGSGGNVSVIGDTYALTGNGVVKIGQSGSTALPSGEDDGTTIAVKATTLRVGLYWATKALESANLANKVGSGYKFGYYDSNRNFNELGSTAQNAITMKPTGTGREVSVYATGTDTLLYKHTNQNISLAVRPVSSSGKAITLFKDNTYYGDFEYNRNTSTSSRLTVINIVNIEDYLKGVITYEMSSSWPLEALKAQALCARTYAMRKINAYPTYNFDLTNDTTCQAYGGTGRSTANSDAAVDQTAGQYVTYNGALCDTLYYSSNGGGSENSENVFLSAIPYLRGVLDPYEKDANSINPTYSFWTRNISKATLAARIVASGKPFGTFSTMKATYSATGNVIAVTFTDTTGRTATFTGNACWNFFYGGGDDRLNSIHFTFKDNGDRIYFEGSGWGHSVGMSQFGAYAMAKYHGANYRQIIRFYYTGVNISRGI